MAAWLPLESNPDVMNKYLQILGVSNKWNIVDVFGLDTEALQWIPRPTAALILLYPITETQEQFTNEQGTTLSENVPKNLFFLKQIVSNACGTIALIHSVANNLDKITLSDGPLKKFLTEAQPLTPEERGELLRKAADMITSHQEIALEGQTEAPEPTTPVNHHFVAFVHVDGRLFELDGRRNGPVDHGVTTSEKLIEDAAKICREYIERDPNDVRFTVVALSASD